MYELYPYQSIAKVGDFKTHGKWVVFTKIDNSLIFN